MARPLQWSQPPLSLGEVKNRQERIGMQRKQGPYVQTKIVNERNTYICSKKRAKNVMRSRDYIGKPQTLIWGFCPSTRDAAKYEFLVDGKS